MRDLSWISEPNIKMVICSIDALKEKNNKLYNDIHECFLTYKEYWDNENITKTFNINILYLSKILPMASVGSVHLYAMRLT